MNMGDIGVLKAPEDLSLELETAHDRFRRDPGLHDLERHAAARIVLLGFVHHAHTTLCDHAAERVASDSGAGDIARKSALQGVPKRRAG